MKHIILLLTGMWVSIIVVAQTKSTSDIAIIPQPVTLETKNASFVVNNQTHVASGSKSADVQRIIRYFTDQVNRATGYSLAVQPAAAAKNNVISFALNSKANTTLGKEGYSIDVSATGVQVTANEPAGLYYATQTLLQLLPKEIESHSVIKKSACGTPIAWSIPGVHIVDYPRFAWGV